MSKPSHTEINLETIYHAYHKNVYNYIAYRINNHYDAEELANDVFVKAMRSLHTYKPALPMEGWLIGIAKNTVIDYLRKTHKRTFVVLDNVLELIDPNKQPEEVLVLNEDCRELMSAMTRLRDKERQILAMKFATGLSAREIGKLMHISESHVGVTTHRALKKLRTYLEQSYKEETAHGRC